MERIVKNPNETIREVSESPPATGSFKVHSEQPPVGNALVIADPLLGQRDAQAYSTLSFMRHTLDPFLIVSEQHVKTQW